MYQITFRMQKKHVQPVIVDGKKRPSYYFVGTFNFMSNVGLKIHRRLPKELNGLISNSSKWKKHIMNVLITLAFLISTLHTLQFNSTFSLKST